MLLALLSMSLAAPPTAAMTLEALAKEPGKKLSGKVTTVLELGAFVDVGGVEGLVHVTDLGWTGEKDARRLVKVGQAVQVTVLSVDLEKKRLSLSMKRDEDSPWRTVPQRYQVGTTAKAKVIGPSAKVSAGVGVFVELEPFVEALVHPSDLPPGTSGTTFAPGTTVEVRILSVDAARQRVGAALLKAVARTGPWRLMGRDTFAREDYVVGEFPSKEAAEAAMKERAARAAKHQDEPVRDEYWIVAPK